MGKTLVAPELRGKLLAWVHSSRFSGHSVVTETLKFVQHSYWWSSMWADIEAYIASCPQCAQASPKEEPQVLPPSSKEGFQALLEVREVPALPEIKRCPEAIRKGVRQRLLLSPAVPTGGTMLLHAPCLCACCAIAAGLLG